MKKLYKATSSKEFCFIFDTEKHGNSYSAALEYSEMIEGTGGDVDNVWEVKDADDIPGSWYYRVPLGLGFKADCVDFMQNKEWAEKVVKRLKEFGYEFEDTFVVDLWKAAKDEDDNWSP